MYCSTHTALVNKNNLNLIPWNGVSPCNWELGNTQNKIKTWKWIQIGKCRSALTNLCHHHSSLKPIYFPSKPICRANFRTLIFIGDERASKFNELGIKSVNQVVWFLNGNILGDRCSRSSLTVDRKDRVTDLFRKINEWNCGIIV